MESDLKFDGNQHRSLNESLLESKERESSYSFLGLLAEYNNAILNKLILW